MAKKKEQSDVTNDHIRGMEYATDTLAVAHMCCGDLEKVFCFMEGVKAKVDLILREMGEQKNGG